MVKNWEKVVEHLVEAEFHKIWKGKELDVFYEFLRKDAIPAKGFLVTFPLTQGGLVWFFYPITEVHQGEEDFSVEFGELVVAVPTEENPGNGECPEEWKGYPVWRVS